MNATLDSTGPSPLQQFNQQDQQKKPVKKAKWHLGIRSQSKPQDIMNEVFKAMKTSNMVLEENIILIYHFIIKHFIK